MIRSSQVMVALMTLISVTAVSARQTALFQVEPLPDQFARAHFLTDQGQVVGLPEVNGSVLVWSKESGLRALASPDGVLWRSVSVSPNGHFLGGAIVSLLGASTSDKVYTSRHLSGPKTLLSWPQSLPANIAPSANPAGTGSGGVLLCVSGCNPGVPITVPSYVPIPPSYFANAISDRGTVVGEVWVAPSAGGSISLRESHALRLTANGVADATTQAGLQALAVNSRGDALLASNGVVFGFSPSLAVWTASGQIIDVPPLSVGLSFARGLAMNDRGEVAGSMIDPGSSLPGSLSGRGFVWTADRRSRVLGTLDGFPYAGINAMNNRGDIVGSVSSAQCYALCVPGGPSVPSRTASAVPIVLPPVVVIPPSIPPVLLPSVCVMPVGAPKAVLWTRDGQANDLNAALAMSGSQGEICQLTEAISVNQTGQILAFGIGMDGMRHVYLLSPPDQDDQDDQED